MDIGSTESHEWTYVIIIIVGNAYIFTQNKIRYIKLTSRLIYECFTVTILIWPVLQVFYTKFAGNNNSKAVNISRINCIFYSKHIST